MIRIIAVVILLVSCFANSTWADPLTANQEVESELSQNPPSYNIEQLRSEIKQLQEKHQKLFDDERDKVIDKGIIGNTEIITNLSNAIYYITALITLLVGIAGILAVLVPYYQSQRLKEQFKLKIEQVESRIKCTSKLFRKQVQSVKKELETQIHDEFYDEIYSKLKERIEKRIDYYEKLLDSKATQFSSDYEKRYYQLEVVRNDFLTQDPTYNHDQTTTESVYEWIKEQQKISLMLMQLISSDDTYIYTALGYFRNKCDKLPYSFLSLLRILNAQGRLKETNRLTAQKIAQDCFEETL